MFQAPDPQPALPQSLMFELQPEFSTYEICNFLRTRLRSQVPPDELRERTENFVFPQIK